MVDKCPIKIAIEQIRNGGYDTSDVDSDVPKIMLGGSDTEYICDDIIYQLNLLTITVARAKLTNAAPETIFKVGEGAKSIFDEIVQNSNTAQLLYKQYTSVLNLIDNLERWVQVEVFSRAKRGQSLNISLPELGFCEEKGMILDNSILQRNINAIVNYFNNLDLTAMSIPRISVEGLSDATFSANISGLLIGDMDTLAEMQKNILLSSNEHSRYQLKAISIIGDIFNKIYKTFPNKL